MHILGFPGGSAGKESACNAGDLSLIPVHILPLLLAFYHSDVSACVYRRENLRERERRKEREDGWGMTV